MAKKVNKLTKVKKWLKKQLKNKKFVITTIVFLVLLVAVVFGLTISFSGILGSVYDVDSIGSNIDKIKIGDSINYTANGYSDWQVLNINKEDNTIDIVSKTSVEDVTVSGYEGFTNYYDILQNTANKYLDGKYAISARSITNDDLNSLKVDDYFWIPAKSSNLLYYNSGSVALMNKLENYYILPVVTINVGDSSVLNVGDNYTYSLNGIDNWQILYKNDSTSISIIPKNPNKMDMYVNCADIESYLNTELQKYTGVNVVAVRNVSLDDLSALNSIDYNSENRLIFYMSDLDSSESYDSSYSYGTGKNVNYYYKKISYNDWDNSWSSHSTNSCTVYSYSIGFRPVVTIKYSDEEKEGKDTTEELKVGDYVKYSANAYNNWKVLNIDKENNTVDIISGGIVKNITLEGKEDYDNLEDILQVEVDRYKSGENVVGARVVDINDLDNLRIMGDKLSVKYFLNNKKNFRVRETIAGNSASFLWLMAYGVGVGYYDMSISSINYDWAVLEYDESPASSDYSMSSKMLGSYEYTAGLRPIITLKLSDVVESDEKDVTNNDNSLVEEQNKANQSSQGLVSNEKIEKDEENTEEENTEEEVLDDPIGSIEDEANKTTQEIKALSESLEAVEEKNKQLTTIAIINLVSTVGVGAFSVFSFFSVFKRFR